MASRDSHWSHTQVKTTTRDRTYCPTPRYSTSQSHCLSNRQKCVSVWPAFRVLNKLPCETNPPVGFRISQVAGAESPPVMKTFPLDSTAAPAPPRGFSKLPVETKFPLASRISHVLAAPGNPLQHDDPKMKMFPLFNLTAFAPPLNPLNRVPVLTREPVGL